MDSIHPGTFTLNHARLVGVFANQGAGALENARLFIEILIKCADQALYWSKRAGRNRIPIWQDKQKITKNADTPN